MWGHSSSTIVPSMFAWGGGASVTGARSILEPTMTDALALGEKLLSLLDESARTTTYKPALLLALIDRVQEHVDQPGVPMRILAERVIELYCPQTLPYQTTGKVLNQSQTRGRATILAEI